MGVRVTVNDTTLRDGEQSARVGIPPGRIEEAMAEPRGRCPDDGASLGDLAGNGLDEAVLAEALKRELLFDAVMRQVASRRPHLSEMGFHLLWCEKIHRGRTRPFTKVRSRIRQLLEERAGRNCQKAFIAGLKAGGRGRSKADGGTPA
jgi:hypothetical protein